MPSPLDSELFSLLEVPAGGLLILSAQPSKFGAVEQALAAYRAAGARHLISLLPDHELLTLGLQSMQDRCAQSGLTWAHCPIDDFSAPGPVFEQHWNGIASRVHSLLDHGEGVALHCRAGLGRTGTVAARILIERGLSASDAIRLVRQTRPGSIETATQEHYLQRHFSQPASGRELSGTASAGVPR
ncbi:MAG: dual specificity protein phosphatase family protein [Rhodoferax sp.]